VGVSSRGQRRTIRAHEARHAFPDRVDGAIVKAL
jgi:hypothetical protein